MGCCNPKIPADGITGFQLIDYKLYDHAYYTCIIHYLFHGNKYLLY